MSQPRGRTALLLVGAAAVAAVVATAPYPGGGPEVVAAAGGPDVLVSVSSDAATPELATANRSVGLLVDRTAAVASREAARARVRWLACPTHESPGCSLAFIRHDAGWRTHPVYGTRSCHTGIDLLGNYGDPVLAAADGVVVRVIRGDPAYGNVTLLQHGPRLRTMYAHQSTIRVHVGERVRVGEVIGTVGSTGFATGPHLHFEVHVDRRPYDPAGWFGGSLHPVACYPQRKY